jgi:hypothetical protein
LDVPKAVPRVAFENAPLSPSDGAANYKDVRMNIMITTVPTLLVSAIYCLWAAYHRERIRRERTLCERVAYMLWVAAERIPDDAAA